MSDDLCWVSSMEDAAERREEEAREGCPAGHYRCGCGRVVPDADWHPLSASPWCAGGCGECLDKMMEGVRRE